MMSIHDLCDTSATHASFQIVVQVVVKVICFASYAVNFRHLVS